MFDIRFSTILYTSSNLSVEIDVYLVNTTSGTCINISLSTTGLKTILLSTDISTSIRTGIEMLNYYKIFAYFHLSTEFSTFPHRNSTLT